MKRVYPLDLFKKISFLCLLLLALPAFSQILLEPGQNQVIPGSNNPSTTVPIQWTFSKQPLGEDQYKLIFEATLDSGWHLYPLHVDSANHRLGSPTVFTFEETGGVQFAGEMQETGEHILEIEDPFYNVPVKTFEGKATFSRLITTNDPAAIITGFIEAQVCNDEVGCQFPSTDFSFGKAVEYAEVADPPVTKESDQTLLAIFIAGFLGGLIALITPCVFPMIPMTVSFFTKSSKTKAKGISNALIYGASIIVIYVLLGFIVTKLLGADALNELASNRIFNLAFFLIFVVFAISFFGFFEITLPSALVNKMDSVSDKGGLIGIFFMAFTLALVSFSCTGPIIGTLLVEAAMQGNNLGPLVGMFGFSFALALPFGLFAAFPGWLNSLPKSGGWLNSVKVVLGFTELALALKFLSVVDLAYHWEFLKREIFIGFWILISFLTGLYILGLIKFPHDSKAKKFSVPRIAFASVFFAFMLYLLPGLNGAPLKLLSGVLPPAFYSFNNDGNKCPQQINCFKDLDEGMDYARLVKKPVLVDFTGWSCASCRRMEDNVWAEPEVLKHLQEDYVLISLYVDDKTPLPTSEQVPSCTNKKLKTIGNKWSAYQTCTFKTSSQPYYVLLDASSQDVLNTPVGYTPDKEDYLQFLQEGLEKFKHGEGKLSSLN